MKKLLICLLFCSTTAFCFAQKQLLSYEDVKYILHNNLEIADGFLVAKGYTLVKKDTKASNRKYALNMAGGSHNNISVRSDGKRLFMEIETNELKQYNLIHESITPYLIKDAVADDMQAYAIKELGNIYITVNDTTPYNPLTRLYDIQIVSDRHITAYN
jgi:predicted house-cleaning NTP pyrophosphatase (Maf/HAM1 superfamily)